MLTKCFIIVISKDTLYHDVKVIVCALCVSLWLASLMSCKYSMLGTPRGRYDEYSSKSSLSCEAKVYRSSRRKPNFRR
jgi:hypothetical protein